jgi:hypothetical protein
MRESDSDSDNLSEPNAWMCVVWGGTTYHVREKDLDGVTPLLKLGYDKVWITTEDLPPPPSEEMNVRRTA